MLNFIKINRLMDEAKEGDGGGSPEATKDAQASTDKSEEGGIETDELGYEVVKEKSETEKPSATDKKEEKPEEEEGKKAVAGYGEEPPKESKEETKEESPPEDDKEYADLKADDLSEDEVKSVKEYAKKHGVKKEEAQRILDYRKEENARLDADIKKREDDAKREVSKKKSEWHRELRDDGTFGGERFANSLKQVDKVMDQFFPETKKMLTEKDIMLSPMVMKEMRKLAEELYSGSKFTVGDPGSKKAEEDAKADDPLAFYSQSS